MPINIVVGLVALLVALVLYTVATIGAFRAKGIKRSHVIELWAGVFFDVLATAMMAIQIGGFGRDLHTALAIIAWAGMTAGAAFATWSLVRSDERVGALTARWLLAPWVFWVLMFLYGMVDRGAKRIGG
jgi:glutamate mutase epsilon subunit